MKNLVLNRTLVGAIGMVLGLSGCSPDERADPPATTLSIEEGGPLTDFGPCEPPPVPVADEAAFPNAIVPPGLILTKVKRKPPTIEVQGYIEMTPIEARKFYQGQSGIVVLFIEDEVSESEMLVEHSTHRTFAKFNAVCESASRVDAVVAPVVADPKD